MFEQTFSLIDLPKVAVLAFLELLLSADNALVLATITRPLTPKLRKKAILIGTASSFVLRAIGIIIIAWLLQYFWIQLIGAAYLLFLSARHLIKPSKKKISLTGKSFWKTVVIMELSDLAFAIDSIVAGLAFIGASASMINVHAINPKLWIVYFGAILGLIGVRYAATLLSKTMDRYPNLEKIAYLIIGWIGLKLGLDGLLRAFQHVSFDAYLWIDPIFWLGIVFLFILGFRKSKKIK